ncbi:MAG: D-alanyl-D-alanine carboxypeptidase, partial [Dongiaceae bacterium]
PNAAKVPAGAEQIGQIDSKPVSALVPGLLRYSNNLSAEMIGLTATRRLTGSALSLTDSSGILADWLKHHLPDIDWRGFHLANHSGLSTQSRASPRQLAALLVAMAHDDILAASLPPLQLSHASASASDLDMVFGKSGTMNYVAGLAGYLTAQDGRDLAFAIFILDGGRRSALDASFDRRILEPTPEMRDWTRRARMLESALIKSWATSP